MRPSEDKHSRTHPAGHPVKAGAPSHPRRRKSEKTFRATPEGNSIGPEDREQMIAEGAYFRAGQRSFEPGRELDDWLTAEIEVDAVLNQPKDRDDDTDKMGPVP